MPSLTKAPCGDCIGEGVRIEDILEKTTTGADKEEREVEGTDLAGIGI
jgi:hypothetical protein